MRTYGSTTNSRSNPRKSSSPENAWSSLTALVHQLFEFISIINESIQSGFLLGACHTDLHAALGDWPIPAKTPLIGGHEGVGIIVAIGNNTAHSPVKLGDRVGIKWLADSFVFFLFFSNIPLTCGAKGASTAKTVGKAENRVSKELAKSYIVLILSSDCKEAKLSGFTVDGTFQEYVVSFVNHVTPIPDNIPSDEAASVLCAVSKLTDLLCALHWFIVLA